MKRIKSECTNPNNNNNNNSYNDIINLGRGNGFSIKGTKYPKRCTSVNH